MAAGSLKWFEEKVIYLSMYTAQLMIQILYKQSDQFNMATDFKDGRHALP